MMYGISHSINSIIKWTRIKNSASYRNSNTVHFPLKNAYTLEQWEILSGYNAKKPQAKYLRFPLFKALFLKMFLIFHSVDYQRFFQEFLLHEQHLHR